MEGFTYPRKTQLCGLILSIILGVLIPSIKGETRVQVSVVVNPVQEDKTAIIRCQTWDIPLGEIVVFEFERQGRQPEQLLWNGQFDDRVGDNFFTMTELQNDGSTIHMLTITYVYRFDAGVYRCKVGHGIINQQFRTTTSGSAYLDVIHFPADIYPSCHIVGNDKSLTRSPGSEVLLGCTSEYGSPRVSLHWTRTGKKRLPLADDSANGAVYSEIRMFLSLSDNGVVFTCTATSDADESYRSTCLLGPFEVTSSPNAIPTFPPAPPVMTTDPLPTPTPNTQVTISAPGAPFLEQSTGTVVCQVWEFPSNYIMSITRTMSNAITETLVYNSLLLGTQDGNLQFERSAPESDNSVIFTLMFNEIQPADGGSYTCTIYKPTSANSYAIKVSDTTMFDVDIIPTTEPPVFATVALTVPSPVIEGDRAYILCVASGITGSGLVMSIESTTSSGHGTLANDGELSADASNANNFFLIVQDNTILDGTLSYLMTITSVPQFFSGNYACMLRRAYGSQSVVSSEIKSLEVGVRTASTDPSQTLPPDTTPLTLPTETTVVMKGPGESVDENGVADLKCQIWGLDVSQHQIYIDRSTPRSTEALVVDGQLTDNVRDYIFLWPQGQGDGSVIYVLRLRFVTLQESGTYTCHVKQQLGSNSLLTIASDSYYLNVVEPTPPPPTPPPVATVPTTGTRAIVSISDNLAHESSTVLFQCHVHELQFYQRVTIERITSLGSESLLYENAIPVSVADNVFVSILPQPDRSIMYYMTIRDVHRSDAGTYTCSIYDTFQRSVTTMSSLELDVAYLPDEGLPICYTNTTKRRYKVGEEISLGCRSGFGKPRVGVHWKLDNEIQEGFRGSYQVLADSVYSELKVPASKEHNNASFICSVTSSAFTDTRYSCSIGPFSVSSAPKTMGEIVMILILSVIGVKVFR